MRQLDLVYWQPLMNFLFPTILTNRGAGCLMLCEAFRRQIWLRSVSNSDVDPLAA